MSRDLALIDPVTRECYQVEPFEDGGTYRVGGSPDTELNVTYNYTVLFPFNKLGGKTAKESIVEFDAFLAEHGEELPSDDYWAPTPGNVAAAIKRLHSWAVAFPDGVWEDRG